MAKSLVDMLDSSKDKALKFLMTAGGYEDMVTYLVKLHASQVGAHPVMDPKRITVIDHGDYQGTTVFVVGASGYQPSTYWYVKVGYGSCSGCDAWESVLDLGDMTEKKAEEAYSLLHDIASSFRMMNDGDSVA